MECRDLCFMFKYLNGGFDVALKDFVSDRTRNSTYTLKLYPVHRHRTPLFRDSFLIVLYLYGTIYVNHPLSSRLNLVLMSTILTNFLVYI